MAEDIIKSLNDRISELETKLNMMLFGAIKKEVKSNNIYDISSGSQKYNELDPEVQQIKDKIFEYKLKRKELMENQKPHEGESLILINEDKQTIKIGPREYLNFETLFKDKKIKYTPSQLKGGMSLIYAIAKVGIDGELFVSDLLPYCVGFKKDWTNRTFEKKGIQTKKNITRNDCDSANNILDACGLSMRLKVLKDKKKISITN